MMLCRSGTDHGLAYRLVMSGWVASAVLGITCVFVGSGGLNKREIGTWGNLALALHIFSLGFLMLLDGLWSSAP
jgi:hypothetical protein